MNDALGRTINYLRLSVTDRCNLRCRYCMPSEGIAKIDCGEILRLEDFYRVVEAATALGISKVRITGGEPLVRKGVIDLIEKISQLDAINEVTLTSNGLLLEASAQQLKAAGVQKVNISLDSLLPQVYREITRGGDLQKVLRGIEAAEAVGLKIKLNMVVMRGINDLEVLSFAALSQQKKWAIRFIEYMPTIKEPNWQQKMVPSKELLTQLENKFSLQALENNHTSGPAKMYQIAGAPGTVGVISPMSEHFCHRCNRIRVTSRGFAKSCLFNRDEVDLRPGLRSSDSTVLVETLREVIHNKPEKQQPIDNPDAKAFNMASIGG
ncbi:GTP 3',8-cyclase MoaA [Malonomonas rubra]|uniref:GTP 3',8-cyclase MoaA n=1 Tax=Malonomonas rubra TaxID=57040 RepID=UPI0026F35374|nr:GTP 3',8-cyclase MoaA [Malonomonas rubra]